MRVLLAFSLLLMTFHSCEKVPEYKQDEGYFKGSMNGFKIETGNAANLYTPIIIYNKYSICDVFGKGILGLAFFSVGYREDPLSTGFFIDPARNLKGKKYTNFFTEEDCQKFPSVNQRVGRSLGLYDYIPHEDNYLKVNEVKNDYITGCFDIKFISKSFIETGIPSKNKQLFPDSIFIVCDKFVAPISN